MQMAGKDSLILRLRTLAHKVLTKMIAMRMEDISQCDLAHATADYNEISVSSS